MKRIRPRLSFANVVSVLALFVALGGGAYAATSFEGADGTIQGCVKSDGTLTVVKPGEQCPRHTHALVLGGGVSPVYQVGGGPEAPNQTTTGDRGDSEAGTAGSLTMQLPAGVYMVNAIAVVQNDDDGCGAVGGFLDSGCGNPQAQYATCLLEKGDKTVDATGSYIQPNSGGQRWGVGDRNGPTGQPGIDSVPLQSVVELSHAGSLTLTCYSPIDNDWFGGNGRGWLALMDDSSIQAVRTG